MGGVLFMKELEKEIDERIKELELELKQAGIKVNLTHNHPYIEKNYPQDVMGMMNRKSSIEFAVNQSLGDTEKQATLEKLVTAHRQGYDSCVVTRDGTYVTREMVCDQVC